MKKKLMIFLFASLLLSGCGTRAAQDGETNEEGESLSASVSVDGALEGTISYKASDYVTLGDYKNLSVYAVETKVTDEDVDYEMDSLREEYASMINSDDAIEQDSYVNADFSLAVDDEVLTDYSSYDEEIPMGAAILGEEVDEALIGHKVGDTVNVSVMLDYSFGDYEGREGVYTIVINNVYDYEYPELTDDFIKEHTDFETYDEYAAELKASLIAQQEEESLRNAGEDALYQAMENSEINGYPEALYEQVKETIVGIYSYYAEWFGMELEELISDEDLDSYVLQETNVEMTVDAILEKEGLTVSDEDFQQYLEDSLSYYEYDSVEELLNDYSESELYDEAKRERVKDFLLENATLERISQDEYNEMYGYEEE